MYFNNVLEVKNNSYRPVGDAKYERKAIKYGNTPWALKQKRKGHSKISEEIKKSLYNWITHHPQVVQSPIANDCLKLELMVKLNRKLFQKFYCRCLPDNFITILLVPQKMVDSNKQEMKMIISLSVIIYYVHYFHPQFI